MNNPLRHLSGIWALIASRAAFGIIPGLDAGGRLTQRGTCTNPAGEQLDLVNCTLNKLTNHFLAIFFAILTGLALLFLIWAGIQYIASQGNADAVKQARQRIINVVIAIVILVASYAIINLILSLAGLVAQRINQ
jgi:hypothetical protein